jgi:hypothetical protein
MATVNPIPGGYSVAGANSITVNLLLSPEAGPASFEVRFPRIAASGANSMSGTLYREMPDGSTEFGGVALNTPTMGDIPFPYGTFTGRDGSIWNVADMGKWRTLVITILSSDGLGDAEPWFLDLYVCVPPGGLTNFTVAALTPQAVVTGVLPAP